MLIICVIRDVLCCSGSRAGNVTALVGEEGGGRNEETGSHILMIKYEQLLYRFSGCGVWSGHRQ